MSATIMEYPLESLPGLPAQEGAWFWVNVKAGKLRVRVPDSEGPHDIQPMDAEDPAVQFVQKWSGAFTRPTQDELDADPRLAYLVSKHLR